MAFGDLIQSRLVLAGSGQTGSIESETGPTSPQSGNLVILGLSFNSSTRDLNFAGANPVDDGFTMINYNEGPQTGGAWYWWYKVSEGDETSIDWASTSTSGTVTETYAEYEWGQGTPSIQEDEDYDASTTTIGSGTIASPSSATNLCIAAHGADAMSKSNLNQSVSNSFIADIVFTTDNAPAVKLSSKLNVSGSTTCEHSSDGDLDQMWGGICVFNYTAGGSTLKSLPLLGVGT